MVFADSIFQKPVWYDTCNTPFAIERVHGDTCVSRRAVSQVVQTKSHPMLIYIYIFWHTDHSHFTWWPSTHTQQCMKALKKFQPILPRFSHDFWTILKLGSNGRISPPQGGPKHLPRRGCNLQFEQCRRRCCIVCLLNSSGTVKMQWRLGCWCHWDSTIQIGKCWGNVGKTLKTQGSYLSSKGCDEVKVLCAFLENIFNVLSMIENDQANSIFYALLYTSPQKVLFLSIRYSGSRRITVKSSKCYPSTAFNCMFCHPREFKA